MANNPMIFWSKWYAKKTEEKKSLLSKEEAKEDSKPLIV
jgi:hypothetical protein